MTKFIESWVSFKREMKAQYGEKLWNRAMANQDTQESGEECEDGFEYNGMWIVNPFFNENGIDAVNPSEYYGDDFVAWSMK